MADFIEVTEGFTFDAALSSDSYTGTRVFMQVDDPSSTMAPNLIPEINLPVLGELWPASRAFGFAYPTNFVVRSINVVPEGGDITKNLRVTVQYASTEENADNQPDNSGPTESLQITGNFERFSFLKTKDAERPKDVDENPLDNATLLVVTANYTYTAVGFLSLQAAANSGSETGKVLATNKNWLAMGTSATQYEEEDTVKFRAVRTYAYKKYATERKVGAADTWQAVWSPIDGKLKLPKVGDELYEEAATFVDTMPTIQ